MRLLNKYWFVLFLCIVGNLCLGFSQTKEYAIIPKESRISFKVSHMGFLTVNGEFHEFSGKLLLTHGKWQGLKSDIRVKSIDTKDTTRDKTIVGDGYLNANTYPLITFTSSRITNDTLTGYLTIKGVRKRA